MEDVRGLLKIFFLALFCCTSPVTSEDGIDASGAGEFTDFIIPDLFDTSASGGGPDTTSDNVGILSEIADQELNGTYIPIAPDALGTDFSDTTTKRGETTVSSTTQETTTTSRTTQETTDEPVTTTTNAPLETSTLEPTTTEGPSSTTTTVVTTTSRTTHRTTTKPPPPKPTLKPVSSTTSTTTSAHEFLPCSFIEEDLECTVELICFGEGEVDCNETDENEPTSAAPRTTEDEYDDEYEDSAVISTEPSRLTGRISPWKKLVAMRRHRFSSRATTEVTSETDSTSTTAKNDPTTTTVPTTTEEAPTSDSTMPASDTTSVTTVPTTSTENPETEPPNTEISPLHVELPMQNDDSSIEDGPSDVQTSSSEGSTSKESPNSETSSDLTGTVPVEVNTKAKTDSPSSGSVEALEETKSRRRRIKRQNRYPMPDSSVLASSESLKLSSFNIGKERKDSKLCRIKGNLQCSPAPTMGICKGRGQCLAPVEKKEKATGEKGVENWAIAVIAICATAAACTIGLLGYLIFTSWKKLKVQPQNGVTTLTYVNNATP